MKYTVEQYNSSWPIKFESIKAFLTKVFLDRIIYFTEKSINTCF